MIITVLAVGDVCGVPGLTFLEKKLRAIQREYGVAFTVVNGENANVVGVTPEQCDRIFNAGADVITLGNHTWVRWELQPYLADNVRVLRPINYGDAAPGRGYTVLDCNGYKILVINAMGTAYIEPTLDSPYPFIDKVLSSEKGNYDIAVLDFHAEATGEKLTLAYAYDGKIQVVFGTHTHVQTADEQILPCGTGYISDVGMCGESGGVLGMDSKTMIYRLRTKMPEKYKAAGGACVADGVIFEVDVEKKRTVSIKRIKI